MEFVVLKLPCLPRILRRAAAASCFPSFLPHSIPIRTEASLHLDKHPARRFTRASWPTRTQVRIGSV